MAHTGLLTCKQVAAWLHASTGFVTKHAEELGGVRIGGSVKRTGRWMFCETKVQNWVNGGGSHPAQARRPNERQETTREESKRIAG